MGFERLFLFQGKKREEENSRQYESWAFPYGSAQKEKIRKLLHLLIPGQTEGLALVAYLTGREAYLGKGGTAGERSVQERLSRAENRLETVLHGKDRRDIPVYLSLILADEQVGPDLSYPTPELLLQQAAALAAKRESI